MSTATIDHHVGTSVTVEASPTHLAIGLRAGVAGRPVGVLGSEYTLVEKANVLRGLIDTFSILYPQLDDVDSRTDVAQLDVPVYVLDAGHELRARRELALEWFALLDAPIKRLVTFGDAGHSVAFEQTDAFLDLLMDEIIPATYPSR
jgi:proline iminopeptidase